MVTAFTVDSASLIVSSYAHVLTGAKAPSIVTMSVNGNAGRITFPTPSSWRLELILSPGVNEIRLRGADSVPTWTPEQVVELEMPEVQQEPNAYFNTLDEHSLLLGLRRNPGEKNWEFRSRLIAMSQARTGSHIEGLFYAMAIELGVKPDPTALGVRVHRDTMGNVTSGEVYWQITPVYLYIDADGLTRTRESHRVDARTRSITLSETPRWTDEVKIYNANDDVVSLRRYSVNALDRLVVFNDDELNGSWVTAHYPYRYRIDHRGLNLGQLKTLIEAITIGGEQILDVVVSDSTLPALGLMRQGRDLITTAYSYVPHAMCQVTPLDDVEWQRSLYNVFGGAYGTNLERYARAASERSNIGWDNLVLDEGLWDTDIDKRALDYLPRLWDPVFGRWHCSLPSCGRYYNLVEFKRYNGFCQIHVDSPLIYLGVAPRDIKSGICEDDSLYGVTLKVAEEL